MFQKIINIFHPERFQGVGKKKEYFEGWYFKIVDASRDQSFALIFGISYDKSGQAEVFCQFLDSQSNRSDYYKFNLQDFSFNKEKFEIKFEKNKIYKQELEIVLPRCHGRLVFSKNIFWPKHWYSPGIMGFLAFLPFLECRHHIITLRCQVHGQIVIDGKKIDLTAAQGYLEKDWGKSFPKWHIWLAGNNFAKNNATIFFSVAKVPFLFFNFTGFISALEFQGKIIKFTSYNLSKIRKITAKKECLELLLTNRRYCLQIEVRGDKFAELILPRAGKMAEVLRETLTAQGDIKLIEKKTNKIIFQDKVKYLGLEIAGKVEEINN